MDTQPNNLTPILAEVMNQVQALKLASRAIDHLLTGTLVLDAFDLQEVDAAFHLLVEQDHARKRKRQGKPSHRETLVTAWTALRKIYWRLYGSGSFDRMGKGGRQRPRLEAAAVALPELITRIEAEYIAYWQAFTEDVFAEIEAALEEAVQE